MAAIVELVILLGSIATAIQSAGYLTTPIVTSPGILPLIVSVAMAAIAGALLVAELIRGDVSVSRFTAVMRSPEFRQRASRAVGWLSLATLYAVATPVFGFTWATLVFLAIALTAFARLAWWRTAIIAVAMATLIPIAFRYLFFTVVP
jgi:hypothetical protein